MTFELIDGEQRNADDPDTFDIPNLVDRVSLTIGSNVKVMICTNDDVERIWVTIVDVLPGPHYVGTLANHSAFAPLKYGDEIAFDPCHVIATEADE